MPSHPPAFSASATRARGDLPLAAAPSELVGQLDDLRAARCADRMAAGKQATARIDGQAPAQRGFAGTHHREARARLGDAELLEDHELGRCGGVVDLDHVDTPWPDPGYPVGLLGRSGDRSFGPVAETSGPQGRRQHANRVGGKTLQASRRRDDDRGRSVPDRRAHQQRERIDDRAARQNLVDGQRLAVLRVGVKCPAFMGFHRYPGEVLDGCPRALHVGARQLPRTRP